jgi:hypothetical protein
MRSGRIFDVEILLDRADAEAGKTLPDEEAIEMARRLYAARTDDVDGFEVWDRTRMIVQYPPRPDK